MRSIQSRLSLGLLISLVAIFTIQWLLVNQAVRVLAEHYISERLMHDAEALLGSVDIDPQGQYFLNHTSINPIFRRPFSGHYYRINIDGQTHRSRSLWDQELSIPDTDISSTVKSFIPGPQKKTLLLLSKQFYKKDKAIQIAVAEDFSPVETDLRKFQIGYALSSLLALGLLIGVQAFLIRKNFTPLNKTRQDLNLLEQGKIEALNENVPGEISPLVKELNRLLKNLRQRLQRSRNALGNLTHAMKTPLTHLQQIGHRDELNDIPEIRDRLLAQATQLQHLIERELTRARLAGHGIPGQHLNASAEIKPLIESLTVIYQQKQLDIQSRLELTRDLTMDREDFLELMGNLLDNACKWAVHRIELLISDNDGLQIKIEDDGPGCAEHELEKLTQRGLRIDEETSGHGLGLAIVQDIIDSYQGNIHFDRSPSLGGLRVQIKLDA